VQIEIKKYGRLTLLERVENHPINRTKQYLCVCDCGKEKKVSLTQMRTGVSLSCGCLQTENRKRKRTVQERLNMSLGQQNKKPVTLETRLKQSLAQMGSKSHNWQGGKTKLIELLRKTLVYKYWRDGVYKRDNYSCIFCSKKGRIEADHIIPFSFLISYFKITSRTKGIKEKKIWNIDNGRTLCRECHKETNTYLKNARATRHLHAEWFKSLSAQ